MAKALSVDWSLAKSLAIKGVPLPEVAKQLGVSYNTLKQRAHRYKWREEVTKTEQAIHHAVTETCADVAKTHVNRVVGLLGKHLDALERKDADTLDLQDFDTATKILDRLDQIGRRAHRLDDENNRTIHVGLIQPVVEIKLTQGVEMTKQAQVVDVQDVKPESPAEQ
jgi:hypothetical protein